MALHVSCAKQLLNALTMRGTTDTIFGSYVIVKQDLDSIRRQQRKACNPTNQHICNALLCMSRCRVLLPTPQKHAMTPPFSVAALWHAWFFFACKLTWSHWLPNGLAASCVPSPLSMSPTAKTYLNASQCHFLRHKIWNDKRKTYTACSTNSIIALEWDEYLSPSQHKYLHPSIMVFIAMHKSL